jgi:hypothetical protein
MSGSEHYTINNGTNGRETQKKQAALVWFSLPMPVIIQEPTSSNTTTGDTSQ